VKVDRSGINVVESWIKPCLPSTVTIPVEKDGKHFMIYVSAAPRGIFGEIFILCPSNLELMSLAKEIADRLEIEPCCAG
jgi:hypothetical protein